MLPHQQRVVDEKAELDTRLSKLTDFMETAKFDGLGERDRLLMVRQKSCMLDYSRVLGERIDTFKS